MENRHTILSRIIVKKTSIENTHSAKTQHKTIPRQLSDYSKYVSNIID